MKEKVVGQLANKLDMSFDYSKENSLEKKVSLNVVPFTTRFRGIMESVNLSLGISSSGSPTSVCTEANTKHSSTAFFLEFFIPIGAGMLYYGYYTGAACKLSMYALLFVSNIYIARYFAKQDVASLRNEKEIAITCKAVFFNITLILFWITWVAFHVYFLIGVLSKVILPVNGCVTQ